MIILEIWKNQPGKFFNISTKSGAGKWKDNFFSKEEFGNIKQFLKDNSDKDIYFCPHGFNRRARSKVEAVIPNLLWADLDFANPDKMVPRPTIAIESSPGRFVGLWVLKGPMTESMNRRLTYLLEADPGGWDLTQVLRFPGTRNYKYASQPRVRVMWDDGPKYSVKKIESLLPPDEETEEGESLSAADVFEVYEQKLPRWVRRELMAKRVTGRVDRSEMLWKLENECLEVGMSMEEAFAVLKRSVWNKFAGRRNEDAQLRRELQKAAGNHFKERPKGKDALHRRSDEEESRAEKEVYERFKLIPLKDIKREKLDFLWNPYLARGEVSILEGDPGLGKSYLAQIVSGFIASGKKIPCYYKGQPLAHGPVMYLDIENSRGTVTKPRLEDNGFKNLDNYYPIDEVFTIDDNEALEELFEKIEQVKPALIVFDTLNTYIGKADTHKASESTQAFGIFKQIASQFGCAVLVLRHLTKGGGSAMYRGQGSVAFSGSARVVMSVGVDPNDTETRAMAITKINFAKAPPALTFRIEERPNGKSAFVWGEYVNLTSQEIMDAAAASRKEGKIGDTMQDAMEFLESTITGAKIEQGKLFRMAEKRSINKAMLERAAARMGVKKKTRGDGKEKQTTWTIKPSKDQ